MRIIMAAPAEKKPDHVLEFGTEVTRRAKRDTDALAKYEARSKAYLARLDRYLTNLAAPDVPAVIARLQKLLDKPGRPDFQKRLIAAAIEGVRHISETHPGDEKHQIDLLLEQVLQLPEPPTF